RGSHGVGRWRSLPPEASALLRRLTLPAEVLDRTAVRRPDAFYREARPLASQLLIHGDLVDRLVVRVGERLVLIERGHELSRPVADAEDGDGGGERHPQRDRGRGAQGDESATPSRRSVISSTRSWTCNSRSLPDGSRSGSPRSRSRA